MGVLRLILAVGVLLHHTHLAREQAALACISAFFVMSGYLIAFTLEQNHRGHMLRFYWFRFLRIFPLYWVTLVGMMIVVPAYIPARIAAQMPDVNPALVWAGIIALWHHYSGVANAPAWSISYELMFYLVAPLLLWGRWAAVVLVSAVCLAGLAYAGALGGILTPFKLTLPDNEQRIYSAFLLFALGMALNYIKARRVLIHPNWAWAGMVVLAAVGLLDRNWIDPSIMLGVFLGVTILAILAEDHRRSSYHGDLCYPVYLIHFPVIVWFGDPMWLRMMEWWGAKISTLITSVVVLAATLALSALWLRAERRWILPLRKLTLSPAAPASR